MNELHIWKEADREANGSTVVSARLECGSERNTLVYEVPSEYASYITASCDPFAVACILMAMRNSARMVVHGQVSPSLLRKLAEWQAAWHCWLPKKYHLIEITADEERERVDTKRSDLAVAAFTGGMDSAFTMARHCRAGSGRLKRNIESGLLVHGFDIPLEDRSAFARAAAKARETLVSVGVQLITMSSNHKELNHEWDDTHGIGIASCLMLLSGRYSAGLIGSTHSYDYITVPWGSNPVTDWLLSSDAFEIVHDGAETSRPRKARVVSQWAEAWSNLRVCFSAEKKDENCGACSKCIITSIGLMALRIELPPSFPQPLDDSKILALTDLGDADLAIFAGMLRICRGYGMTDSWLDALERCVKFNQRRKQLLQAPAHPWQKFNNIRLGYLVSRGP